MKTKKKGYFWKSHEDADYGVGVVAYSWAEARKLGYDYWGGEVGHGEDDFIEQRCRRVRSSNVEKLSIGAVDVGIEGLEAGLYGFIEDTECPVCEKMSTIYKDNDIIGCSDCVEKAGEKIIKQSDK